VTSNCKKHKKCKCCIVDEPDFNTGDGEAVQILYYKTGVTHLMLRK
jgi:hypothetical protein